MPEDFYLREFMELDPRDLDAVAAMMRTYGYLGGSITTGSWDNDVYEHLEELTEREHPRYGPFALHGELATFFVTEAQTAINTWLALRREGGLDALIEPEVSQERLAQVRADGVHPKVRLGQARSCVLVLIGVRVDGAKELIALAEGLRESTESWADLLRDCRRRGMRDPELVVGDGAMGLWRALAEAVDGGAPTGRLVCHWAASTA